jgi:hypothetical protein
VLEDGNVHVLRRFSAALVGVVAAVSTSTAAAERRPFAFTFDHAIQPEYTLDVAIDTASRHLAHAPNQIDGAVSIDYGVSEHVDVTLYHAVAQTAGDGLGFRESRLRVRRRFGERGEYPVDFGIHGAIAKPFGVAAIVFAPAIVIGRDVLGGLTLVANAGAEIVVSRSGAGDERQLDTVVQPTWAAGASVDLQPQFRGGFEAWGRATDESFDDVSAWFGPAVSFAPTVKLWLNTTFGVSLVDGFDDVVFRMIAGVAL